MKVSKRLSRKIASTALTVDNTDALRDAQIDGKTVTTFLTDLVAKIGENMSLRRMEKLSVSSGVVEGYIHNAAAPGMGRIGVLVALESTGDTAKLNASWLRKLPCISRRHHLWL